MASTRLLVNRWIRSYTKAWLKKDAKAIASLFTEDATYHSHPFRPVTHGKKSILDYTLGVGCWTGVRGSFWKASR